MPLSDYAKDIIRYGSQCTCIALSMGATVAGMMYESSQADPHSQTKGDIEFWTFPAAIAVGLASMCLSRCAADVVINWCNADGRVDSFVSSSNADLEQPLVQMEERPAGGRMSL